VPAIAPAMVGRGQNRYYKTEEEYVVAIAEALRTEYRAIVDAGFILQIDDPGLGETWDMLIPAPPLEEYRRTQARNLDALNHALAGIPEDRVRYHLCWGSWQGPHLEDLSLRDVVDLVLRVKAQAYSIEAATPRHSYEWRVWEDVKLPEGKVLIPGVIAHTTAVVEHPETIAERLMTYARLVGREHVMAGADCGFAQGALFQRQHPSVMCSDLAAVTQAHIHFGKRHVAGGIIVFLCTNLGNGPAGTPACPDSAGTVTGSITAASIIGPAARRT